MTTTLDRTVHSRAPVTPEGTSTALPHTPGAAPHDGRRSDSHTTWSSLGTSGRARLLAACSGIALQGTSPSPPGPDGADCRSAAEQDGTDVASRCDRVLRDVAVSAAALPIDDAVDPRSRTELVVDVDFPLERAALHLAAALIDGESVLFGLSGEVTAGTLRYVRAVAALLPEGVLQVSRGDRLVAGGTDRVVWLSPGCVTDRSPTISALAAVVRTWSVVDGTSDPARPPAAPTS